MPSGMLLIIPLHTSSDCAKPFSIRLPVSAIHIGLTLKSTAERFAGWSQESDVSRRRSIRQSLRQPPDGAAVEILASLQVASNHRAGVDFSEVFRRRARPLSHQSCHRSLPRPERRAHGLFRRLELAQPKRNHRNYANRSHLRRTADDDLPARVSANLLHAVDRPESNVRSPPADLSPPAAPARWILRQKSRRTLGNPRDYGRGRTERNVHLRRGVDLRRYVRALRHPRRDAVYELETGADYLRGTAFYRLFDQDFSRQSTRLLPAHSRRHCAHQFLSARARERHGCAATL